ncbi:ral GTPase-activating protein subunit alpha-2 isoform X1 [Electrophorus electricus]|uniref:ral GTPase-activating protein subunit alpha-2 isoform X1 n=1 Tax=Electrophorus electricus TaxID=8005 RepID=UPI0015CFE83A|nr:ral GTPase-activating protein subunit alpha-2 isoform X1 [Electrophorus electricus]
MFTRRGYGDVKKSTQKVLDPKKDVLTRLKHLRSLLDISERSELKTFFETNCSQIYFIFYENFITLESNLKQRGNKSHREELDSILFIFEKILQLLPEKINSRWQFHSIGSILKKLLHTGNSFKIRCEGMRLFLLWLQALQTHCAEEQLLIFACLVPGFPAVPSSRGPCTLDTIIYNPFSNPPDAKIVPEEITPLVPAIPGEKISDDQTCYILQTVLKFMVVQASSLEWHKKDNQDSGFRFLFSLFKKYYLPHLFPSFTKLTNLYKPLLDLPHHRPKPLYVQVSRNNESTFCTRDQYLAPRVAFITWLVNFFLEKKYMSTSASNAKNGGDVLPKLIQTVTAGSSSQEKSSEPEPNGPAEQEKSHSNSSTLSDRHASNSSLCSVEEEHRSVYDMVHCILLSTPDNVNFVNEVFHQAFLLPSCEASATRKVIKVYRKWILQDRPAFMSEPDKTGQDEEDTGDDHQTTEADSTHAQVLQSHGHKRTSSWGRTYSFSSAISRGCLTEEQRCDVKAGMQATLQVFLTNSANVFLLEPCQDVPKLLENQVEVCRAVLSIYRRMIMEQTMNRQTWEQMLQVLLRITEAVMKRPQDDHRKDAFAQSLASVLFRTIIVAWVRANLSVFISRELWDELLAVLSSLSHWEELVHEWANIMDSLTMVLARCVYGLDLNNLPLDKLSEQKEKKQRGRGVMQDSQKAAAVARSFSLSWRNAGEQAAAQEPMRFRSATTTGAPAVEKARNNVRQKASAKRSQSISNCVHLCEALPATKSVPVLLHTVSSFLPGISHNSHCSHRLSDVDEGQLSECGGEGEMGDGDSPLPRSSSTSDITQQLTDSFPETIGERKGDSPNAGSSDGRVCISEHGSSGKRESEAPTIMICRSSSPADLDCPGEGAPASTRATFREKSESVSSETSNSYLNDAEVNLLAWQAVEEERNSPSPTGANGGGGRTGPPDDAESQRSLLLSHTEALAGSECAHPLHSAPLSPCPPISPILLLPQGYSDCPQLLEDAMHMPPDLDSSEFLADDISIIAGGCLTGWHADSAFVLWRRILGILGDVNNIRCPRIHAKVFSYLYELWHRLAKIRDNLGINIDNQSALPSALFIPPLRMLASWLFKATMLPADFKMGKLQAYRLICEMMTKHQDVLPNTDFLVHLYHVMRKGFTSDDQDVLNTMIRCCSPRFFFLGLPGFTMLVGDFISAAARVLSADSFEAPRIEAQTLLGSLVCFPNLYQQIPSLQAIPGIDIKEYLVNNLLRTARNEPCEEARCVAICSLGLWVCEELGQQRVHHQVKDAINVLGVTLKFGNKSVSHVACDVFQLLICHWRKLQNVERSLPKRIIEIFVATIAFLLPSAEHSMVEADKKLMVSLLLCLLDWCMSVPLSILLEPITMPVLDDPASQKAPLLDYIYRVLHCCVSGSNLHTQQSHYLLSLSDLSTDYDPFLPLSQVKSSEPAPSPGAAGDFGNLLTVAEEKKRRNMELIPLTARMIMTHLVNHLGHHPLSGGPALLHSLVNENHDNPYVESSELSSEVFKSPNLQLFVFNDSTLVSYLQIPTEGPPTALSGLSPREHSSEVRVIVRDISGKYSWDCSVLYKTLEGTSVHCSSCREESLHQYAYQSSTPSKPGSSHASRCSSVVEVEDGIDVLDQLLENLGISSPECLPEPQLRLTQPAPPPMGMNHETEGAIMETIQRQAQQEGEELARRRSEDPSIRAAGQREPTHQEPKAPFYFCRLLLNELGMNSWDRRKSFHLLKKNSKLLRELKNLDSRQCRETHKIAVFYIGEGQEDKCSILSNTEGSQAYEEFVSGLGWEVDLATHCGFMGGLQRNGSTGTTAPYYSTSNVEVIFHVSTRMPSDSDDSVTKKLRHLGNDEVHIVWSEHTRDYRRGIIPTDFGDVLIIIYPMKNHTFFIQIMKKAQVPFFGPLFDGAIVTGVLLPSLVRATCINASRAVKSRLTLYQSFYEERALYLEAIILNHKENMTFEDFAAQVFSPSQSYYPTSGTGSLSGSTSAELSATVTTSESTEQVSPTMPRASKNRVSGKLRRSASAISKSSN